MKRKKLEKGITLIALVVTIIVLLILAGVTISIAMRTGIMDKAEKSVDQYNEESAREKLKLALIDYKMGQLSNEGEDLQYYLDKIDAELIETTDTEYIIELDGYEFIVDKVTLEIISSSRVGGIRPIIEISIYQENGSEIVNGEEYEKLALTVKISNKAKLTSLDEVILKDEEGNIINACESIIGDSTADKSFIINKNGVYTAFAKGTKDEIQKTGKKVEKISLFTNTIYTVSYTNNVDNMDNWTTYNKTQETSTSEETTKLNEIKSKDSSIAYNRAVKNDNGTITAIAGENRTSDDEQIYLWGKYDVVTKQRYAPVQSTSYSIGYADIYEDGRHSSLDSAQMRTRCDIDKDTGGFRLSGGVDYVEVGDVLYFHGTVTDQKIISDGSDDGYGNYSDFKYNLAIVDSYTEEKDSYFGWYQTIKFKVYKVDVKKQNYEDKGAFEEYTFGGFEAYTNDAKTGTDWYVRDGLMKKYKLYKYDEDLNLKSIYDVESKEIKTVPINISDKGDNKVMLSVNATGNDYKVFISGDNTNWQQVENVTSGTQKELEVNNWSNLYIKIETNTSTINDIEVSYMEN